MSSLVRIICCLLLALANGASGQDVRKWTAVDGKTFEGRFLRQDGAFTVIKGPVREVKVETALLSFADREHIRNAAPAGNKTAPGKGKPPELKVPLPAKSFTPDPASFKTRAETVFIAGMNLRVLDTQHFRVFYDANEPPVAIARLAEKICFDFIFLHPVFESKLGSKQIAIFFLTDDKSRDSLHSSLVSQIPAREAEFVGKLWQKTAALAIPVQPGDSRDHNILNMAQYFNARPADKKSSQESPLPRNINALSSTLLRILISKPADSPSGEYALRAGFPVFKELQIAGKSETSVLNFDVIALNPADKDVTRPLGDLKSVARETEKLLKEGIGASKLPVTLQNILNLSPGHTLDAWRQAFLLSHAMVRFLNKDTRHMECFAALMKGIGDSGKMPSLDEIAAAYGYADAAATEKEFQAYVKSPSFARP